MAYIDGGSKDEGCIFCTLPRQSDLRAALVLAQTEQTVVMMNKYPYNNGHLLLAPKRHENDLARLSR
jgi:ATP adenylyltransferase